MKNINQLESLKVFRSVVECGSFTAAAKRLCVSTGWVSKVIVRLEKHLGSALFIRNTRSLHLTVNGKRCYAQAGDLINLWENMAGGLASSQDGIEGRIRISAPVSWGLVKLCPLINEFIEQYPGVDVDVELNDQHVNVIGEQFDMVLRIAPKLSDSSLLARRIRGYRRIACASPAYQERCGIPERPCDLKTHEILMYSISGDSQKWQFYQDNRLIDIDVKPKILSNNSLLLKSALLAGRGVALIPEFLVAADLADGSLVRVLQDFPTVDLNLYSVRPGGAFCTNRLAIFQEFLYDRLCGEAGQ